MEIDLRELEARHAHDLLSSCIIPRPIAWVSTINRHGKINIAPFRLQEAKVSFECALDRIVCVDEGADAGNLIIGRVRLAHIRDNTLDGREVNWRGLDALGRLSGNRYRAIENVIESEKY